MLSSLTKHMIRVAALGVAVVLATAVLPQGALMSEAADKVKAKGKSSTTNIPAQIIARQTGVTGNQMSSPARAKKKLRRR
jgi:hypothetical protein